MNSHKDQNKPFQILPDYDKELQEIWCSNLRSVKSKVQCESSSTTEEIKSNVLCESCGLQPIYYWEGAQR